MLQTRRRILGAMVLVGIAGFARAPHVLAAEDRLEATAVRLRKGPSLCSAPFDVMDELLRAEGFTDIRYVPEEEGIDQTVAVARGQLDFALAYAPQLILGLDRGLPLTALGPVHPGCFEVFGGDKVHSIGDLKGKRVGIGALGSPRHLFLSVIAAHVGINPQKDIEWVTGHAATPMQYFVDGKVDAFLGFPPQPQELRARKIGRIILDATIDNPWWQYVCCMLLSRRDYVEKNPVATKKMLRALLKATDFCAAEPAAAARRLVEGGFANQYDYAVQTIHEVPYGKWRELDSEDTLRFYAVRLYEAGMTKLSPQRLSPRAPICASSTS